MMLAVMTDFFDKFFKAVFDPKVAANLQPGEKEVRCKLILTYHNNPNPLSRRVSKSGVKNIRPMSS